MKFSSLFISCLLVACVSVTNSFASETFIVSGNPKAPPVVWEEYNKLIGVGPDIAKSVLTELKLNFGIQVQGDWQQVQDKCL